MRKYTIIFLSVFFTFVLYSDTSIIDSLKNKIKITTGKEQIHLLNELGKAYWGIDPEKTFEYSNQALKLSKQDNYPKGIAQSLNNIGVGHYFLGEYDAALDLFLQSLTLRENIGDKKDIVSSYNNIGIIYDDLSDYEKALEYYQKALKLYEELEDKKGIADALHNIGVSYRSLSRFNKSLECYLRALKIYEEIEDKNGISSALGNIGIIYNDLSYYDKSLEYHLACLKANEELNDKTGIALSMKNIGIVYKNLGNYKKAIEYYQQSMEVEEKLGDKSGVASSLNNMGIIYDDLKEFELALEYYLRSDSLYEEIGDKSGVAKTINNIGVVYEHLEDYDNALKYHQKSLVFFQESKHKKGIAASLKNMGSVYLKMNQYDQALESFEQSLEIVNEIQIRDLMIEIYEGLSDLYSAQNNFRKALAYYKLYSAVKDSIFTKEIIERVAGMETSFEVRNLIHEHEKEIELLQKNNEIYRLAAEKQKLVKWRLYSILLVFLAAVFIIYYRYTLKNKTARQLKEVVEERTKDLKKTNDDLLKEISERKHLETQLRITERLAGIGELAAGVAHEIRNPIAIIKSTAQYCQTNYKNLSEEKINKMMDIFTETSDRISKTVKDLVEFAKPKRDSFKKGDIITILNKIISSFESKFLSHHIIVKKDFAEDLPLVLLDEDQMYGALLNLILNAVDAMQNGGTLTLSAEKCKENLIIKISDTGVGISKENLKKIFNPFFTTKKKGTGLGLSLVHQVMDYHQSQIEIVSEIGKGSDVILKIPIQYR
ncbi:MAG TPA: tetratricopeptide repeat protein [Candidatus Cloacimonetes bacterium]|nr:tetratricopeptide repeat protein [Candidatus Cloacimonadota bacterium]